MLCEIACSSACSLKTPWQRRLSQHKLSLPLFQCLAPHPPLLSARALARSLPLPLYFETRKATQEYTPIVPIEDAIQRDLLL